MKTKRIVAYRGKRIERYSKDELIEIIGEIIARYEEQTGDLTHAVGLLGEHPKRSSMKEKGFFAKCYEWLKRMGLIEEDNGKA